MRRIISAITTFAMALSMLATAQAAPAAAAGAIDSDYFGESAFLTLAPGQAGQFAVGFNNTGSNGWQVGTSTQVDLAICQADKLTCNTASPNAAWANNWYSSIAYATQSTNFVGPTQTGWFVYSVRAPAGTATGTTARFNGDLALHATLAMVHQQGYYQDATVAAATSAPTAMTLAPAFQSKQIGQTATITANVTADPPSGSTTRQPSPNYEVTFQVPASGLNPAITATAITDTNGNATFSYTRNNPSNDTVTAYVSAQPTVRATANVLFGTAASTFSVTPKDAATLPNTNVSGTESCRNYTLSAQDVNGNPITTNVVANFLENKPTTVGSTTDADGGATINGTSPLGGTNVAIVMTPPAGGTGPATATVTVCGAGSTKTVTLIAWQDANTNLYFDAGEYGDAGGPITYQARIPTITVTPKNAQSLANGTEAIFTVTATDQFGAAFTGPLVLGTVENTDNVVATSSNAIVPWFDNRATATGVPTTTATAACGVSTGATANATVGQKTATASPNSSGTLTFALCSTSATSGTAVAFQDVDGNLVRAADEAGDTGSVVTWSTAALTSCTISVNRSTAPTSAGAGEPNTTTAGVPDGNVTYTLKIKDQSGSPITVAGSYKYAVSNTGTNGLVADTTNTAVAGGASANFTHTPAATTQDTIILDAGAATGASVTGTFTRTSDGAVFSCGSATNSWIQASDAQSLPANSTITGTVIFVDKTFGGTGTTTDGFGAYVLQTSGSGNYYVSFDSTACAGTPTTCTNDVFTIVGTSSSGVQFEAALSVGDVVTVTTNGTQPPGIYTHNMTTNAP